MDWDEIFASSYGIYHLEKQSVAVSAMCTYYLKRVPSKISTLSYTYYSAIFEKLEQ